MAPRWFNLGRELLPGEVLRLIVLIGSSTCLAFAVLLALVFRDSTGATAVAIAGLLIAAAPIARRFTPQLAVPLNYIAVVTWLGVLFQSSRQGGLESPTLTWLLTIPMYLTICRAYRSAGLWLCISIASALAFYLLDAAGLRPASAPVALPGMLSFSSFVGLFLATSALVLIVEASRRRALDSLEQTNRRLASAQRSLEQAEMLLTQTLNALPSPVALRDAEGRYLLVNQAHANLYGHAPGHYVGRTAHELFAPQDAALIQNRDHLTLTSPTPLEFERAVTAPNGAALWIGTHRRSLDLQDGRRAVLSVEQDLTRRRQAEDVLREAMAQSVAAARAKSEFLANMSHEIRTPMNGVLGMAELLRDTPLDARQRRYVDAIHHSGESLLRIINDVLDFSKIEAGKLTLEEVGYSLRSRLEHTLDLIRGPATSKGLVLNCRVDPTVPARITGDPVRLQQVLLNLLGNAVKFTERGSITLTVTATPAAPNHGGRLHFVVTDTGIGIEPDAQARLFTAFSQADGSTTRRFGGTGLGLAISRQLVHLMGGELELSSAPGQGSTFTFSMNYLPAELALEDTGDVQPADAAHLTEPTRADVLIVDDNPVNREIACAMLESASHRIQTAEDGHQAIAAVCAHDFDLVLMDCQMPGLDGFEATAEIRRREAARGAGRRVRIIALTANAIESDRGRCLAAGMDDYLSKPFTSAQLLAMVTRHLETEASAGWPAQDPPPRAANGA